MTAPELFLTGTGWRTWADLGALLDGCDCLWVDLDGPHAGTPPTQRPLGATHFWAWSTHRWLRLRLDGANVAGAVLHDRSVDDAEPVTVRRYHGRPWGKDYGRTARWEPATTFLVTDTAVPLTFVVGLES